MSDAANTNVDWVKNSSLISLQVYGQSIFPTSAVLSKRELLQMQSKLNDFISLHQTEFTEENLDGTERNAN